MLRLICGKTLRNGLSNEMIRDMTGVEKICGVLVKRMDEERARVKAKKNCRRRLKERHTEA